MFSVKPPKIKTRTITVKKTPATTADSSPSARTPSIARQNSVNGSSSARKASTPVPPASRYRLSSAPVQSREPSRQSLSVSRVHQRKRKVTPTTPQWASSDESSDDDNEDDDRLGVKRQKTRLTSTSTEPMNLNRCLDPDLKRQIRIQEEGTVKQGNGVTIEKRPMGKKGKLVHGMEMTLGEFAKEFKSAFPGSDKSAVLELQYPSTSRPEKFEAVMPLDRDEGYNPLEDIYFSIEEIIQNYFPEDMVARYSSDVDGPVRLLKRAVSKNSLEDFEAALDDFNNLIRDKLSDGTIPRVMDDMHAIPLSLVKRITAQTYQRIVSPQAHRLRKVRGKETTYGELLPPFVHKFFHQTGLNSSSVFVDLGSGVGNVVLQSALQTGAESWGIEIMELAASLGTKQASELRARARLWNIALGPMHLLKGSFFESPEIDEVLRRADVVLVNNKVFGQKINNELLQKFLDLKEGCKVVSLESFGGGAKQGVRNEQSIAGLFDEEQFESGTASVSWAGESVEYFIATKAR